MPRVDDQGRKAKRRDPAGRPAAASRPGSGPAAWPPGFVAGAPDVAGRRVVVVVVGVVVVGVVVLPGPRICQCHRCLLVWGTRGMRGGLWPGPSVPGSGLRLIAASRFGPCPAQPADGDEAGPRGRWLFRSFPAPPEARPGPTSA